LTWSPGVNNGGTPVIDYILSKSTDGKTFSLLCSGILTTSYIDTTVTMGTTYYYEVQARNLVGVSSISQEVSILAASIPTT
jgi:hypothetical protein